MLAKTPKIFLKSSFFMSGFLPNITSTNQEFSFSSGIPKILIRFPGTNFSELKLVVKDTDSVYDLKLLLTSYTNHPTDDIILKYGEKTLQNTDVITADLIKEPWECLFASENQQKDQPAKTTISMDRNSYEDKIKYLESLQFSRIQAEFALKTTDGDLQKAVSILQAKSIPVTNVTDYSDEDSDEPRFIGFNSLSGSRSSKTEQKLSPNHTYKSESASNENTPVRVVEITKISDPRLHLQVYSDEEERKNDQKRSENDLKTEISLGELDNITEQFKNPQILYFNNAIRAISYAIIDEDAKETIDLVQSVLTSKKPSAVNKIRKFLGDCLYLTKPEYQLITKLRRNQKLYQEILATKSKTIRDLYLLDRTRYPATKLSSMIKKCETSPDLVFHKISQEWDRISTDELQIIAKIREDSSLLPPNYYDLIIENDPEIFFDDDLFLENEKMSHSCALIDSNCINISDLIQSTIQLDFQLSYGIWQNLFNESHYVTKDEFKQILYLREHPEEISDKLKNIIGNKMGNSQRFIVIDRSIYQIADIVKKIRREEGTTDSLPDLSLEALPRISANELRMVLENRREPGLITVKIQDSPSLSQFKTREQKLRSYENLDEEKSDKEDPSFSDSTTETVYSSSSSDDVSESESETSQISTNQMKTRQSENQVTHSPVEESPPKSKERYYEPPKTRSQATKAVITYEDDESSSFEDYYTSHNIRPSRMMKTRQQDPSSKKSKKKSILEYDYDTDYSDEPQMVTYKRPIKNKPQTQQETPKPAAPAKSNSHKAAYNKTRKAALVTQPTETPKPSMSIPPTPAPPIPAPPSFVAKKDSPKNKKLSKEEEFEDFLKRLRELVITREIAEDLMKRTNNNPGWAMVTFLFDVARQQQQNQ